MAKKSKIELKSRMKNLLMFLPNMVALCARLMVDKRVPRTERALLAAAVIYAIIPFDFIPDMIPFVGQIDDLFLISLTVLRLIDRTDDTVVREHWRGGGDIVQLQLVTVDALPKGTARRSAGLRRRRNERKHQFASKLLKRAKETEKVPAATEKTSSEPAAEESK